MTEPLYSDERIRQWIDYELDSHRQRHGVNPRRIMFQLAVNMRDDYEAALRRERERYAEAKRERMAR